MDEERLRSLESSARAIRIDTLDMFYRADYGHIGGSYSIVELLTALYFTRLRIDPARPGWPDRDRFILSKGHA